jgi:hypothetical protein
MKNFSEVFLESTDDIVLSNCALSLTALAKGDHARIPDAQMCLKKTVRALQNRLLELLEFKVGLVDKNSSDFADTSPVDTEHSIGLCFRRLSMLSKRVYIGKLLVDSGGLEAQDNAVESLYSAAAEYVAKELDSRKIVHKDEEDADETLAEVPETLAEVPEIWTNGNDRIHEMVGEAVSDTLCFLLCVLAWRVNMVVEALEKDEKKSTTQGANNHIVVRMRDQLVKLIILCFEQYLEPKDIDVYSKAHVDFSVKVQKEAGRTAGDIRSLFPKAWSSASSPSIAAFSLVDDGGLIGGFVRFFRSQDDEVCAFCSAR